MRQPDWLNGDIMIWRTKMEAGAPVQDTAIAAWLIREPIGLLWNYYSLRLNHLRELQVANDAHERHPEATNELVITALALDHDPNPDDLAGSIPVLSIDHSKQFTAETDQVAIDRVSQLLLQSVLHGQASCDPTLGNLKWWQEKLERT